MPTNSLEQEAMDRVRRMYASFDTRSKRLVPPPAVGNRSGEKQADERPEPEQKPGAATEQKPKSLLDVFLKDQDQSLILLLLVLLMKDGGDMDLLLALMYLLI